MYSRRLTWNKVILVAVFLLCVSFSFAGPDHTNFIQAYNGSSTCLACHPGRETEVMGSVHFQWRTESDKVEYPGGGSHGMIDRACGLVGSSAMINYYESCGKCHVGSSLPFPDPQTGQFTQTQKDDLDCLICHAKDYDTNNDGVAEPGELAGDRVMVDGKWKQDRRVEAARTVGLPTTEACLRCHHHGQADYTYKRGTPFEHETDVHAAAGMTCTDCHFTDNHKIARGSRISDMFANDLPNVDVTCEGCHTEAPHKTLVKLNDHVGKIACETCHIPELAGAQRRIWAPLYGVTEGPEANIPVLNPETGKYEPYSVYDEGLVSPSYRWFNGNSSMLAEPIDTTGAWDMQPATAATVNAKIYPFRNFVSGQPMDALGIPGTDTFNTSFTMQAGLNGMAPSLKAMGFMRPDGLNASEAAMMGQFPNMLYFDRTDYFTNGNVAESISIGLAKMGGMMQGMDVSGMSRMELLGMGAQMWSGQVAGLALPNTPYAPGYLDDQDPSTVTGSFISVSHAIKKVGALSCRDCHSQNGSLNFEALGYTSAESLNLKTLLTGPINHADFIGQYAGPKTCEGCHPGKTLEMQGSTHYKFESDLPAGYQKDANGNPVSYTRSGKLWKLCGFPTAMATHNWMGVLRDDPATPNVDTPGGCAKCHVGIGLKPFNAVGKTSPSAAEADNMDCLVCHANTSVYTRQYFVETAGGEPVLNALGSPVVMTVPKADGVLDWSVYTAAAGTVGKTSSDNCQTCHAAAGGGKMVVDGIDISLKRGEMFSPGYDVHAGSMSCSDCHYASGHRFKRPLNNDLSAYDNVVEGDMCSTCHGSFPHEDDSQYNAHVSKIACTTCHTSRPGGAHFKDFSQPVAPDPSNPLAIWELKLTKTERGAPVEHAWFNGTVGPEITPLGSHDNGKIYPFKHISFVVPQDANNHAIPVKWATYYKTGNMLGAVTTGRDLYSTLYTPELAAATGIPPVPGEFDHFGEGHKALFSIGHGITEDHAKTCGDCHTLGGEVDFASLGYSESDQAELEHRVMRPLELSATNGDYSFKVVVSWTAVTGAGAYRVWRAGSEVGEKIAISGWISGTSFADTSAEFGTDYYYWVQAAENNSGSKESPLSPFAVGSVSGSERNEEAFLVTVKKCNLVMDSPSVGSISLIDTTEKSSLKIKFLKKGIPAVIKEKPGQLYITAASIPEVFIMGDFGKVFTDAPIDNLFGEGLVKSITAKNCNIGNLHISGQLGSVKVTALENAVADVSTFAHTSIMTGDGPTKMKVNLVGVILENLSTGQPVSYIKTASKKYKDANKQIAASLAGIGTVGRVVQDILESDVVPLDESGSSIEAPMGVALIATKGGPIVCDSIIAPVKKIQASTEYITTAAGVSIAGGNIRCQNIQSDMVMSIIQAKFKSYGGEVAGGLIGYPGYPGATQIFVQGVSTIDGQGGVSGLFMAGYEIVSGDPTFTGAVKKIKTKAGILEGMVYCSNQPKFTPEQGEFEVVNN